MVLRDLSPQIFRVTIDSYKYLSIQCLANEYNSDKISLKPMLKESTFSMEFLWKHFGVVWHKNLKRVK